MICGRISGFFRQFGLSVRLSKLPDKIHSADPGKSGKNFDLWQLEYD